MVHVWRTAQRPYVGWWFAGCCATLSITSCRRVLLSASPRACKLLVSRCGGNVIAVHPRGVAWEMRPSVVRWCGPQVLKVDEEMQQLAKHLRDEGSLLLFGRGYNYATALEAALKVKEVALMHRCRPGLLQVPALHTLGAAQTAHDKVRACRQGGTLLFVGPLEEGSREGTRGCLRIPACGGGQTSTSMRRACRPGTSGRCHMHLGSLGGRLPKLPMSSGRSMQSCCSKGGLLEKVHVTGNQFPGGCVQ